MTPLPPPPYPATAQTPLPPGQSLVFSPMPQISGGGYLTVLGFTYRFAATTSGLASATRDRVLSYVTGLGFDQVVVWMKGETLPSDWTSPPNADVYIQGRCQNTQTIPASKSVPLVISGNVVDARWWGYQPTGVTPNPPPTQPGVAGNTSTSSVGSWVLGGAVLAAAIGAAEWWKRRRRR